MSALLEKPRADEVDHVSPHEKVDRNDGMATEAGISLESFAHLDEKKILRKVGKLMGELRATSTRFLD